VVLLGVQHAPKVFEVDHHFPSRLIATVRQRVEDLIGQDAIEKLIVQYRQLIGIVAHLI